MITRLIPKSAPAKLPLHTFRAKWRDELFFDHDLQFSSFKVGYALTMFLTMKDTAAYYHKTGKVLVWPSQERIREQSGIPLGTISAGIKELIERGHLSKTKRGNQVLGSNCYRLILKERASTAHVA